jgi:hypothetical protein
MNHRQVRRKNLAYINQILHKNVTSRGTHSRNNYTKGFENTTWKQIKARSSAPEW